MIKTRVFSRRPPFRWPPLAAAIAVVLALAPSPVRAQRILGVDDGLAGTLLDAIGRSNPDLLAHRAAALAARSRAQATGFAPPAVLSAEVEEVPGIDFGSASYRLTVGREFPRARSGAERALAATEVQVAEAALDRAELRVRAAAVRSLIRASGWTWVARRLAAEDTILIEAETSLRVHFAAGGARYTDVLRLRTERARVQSERAQALAEARIAVVALEGLLAGALPPGTAQALAVPPSVALLSPDALPPPPNVDSLVALSGPVRAAEVQLEQVRAARTLGLAERRTQIAADVGLQGMDTEDGYTLGPTLGFSVTLPFSARAANRAAAEASARSVVAAEAELAAARAEVRAGLMEARVRYEAARERLASFDVALLVGVREEREGALAAYRTGEVSLIELLDFERAIARVEVEQRLAMIDAAVALADLTSGAAGSADEGFDF